MVSLGLLLTRNHRLLSIAAMLDMFETINRFYVSAEQEPKFEISLFYPGEQQPPGYSSHQLFPISSARQLNLILIPAFSTQEISISLQANSDCIPWLKTQYAGGAELASFCTGAFLLAASGLLNGKPATTHIHSALAFQKNYPDVELRASEVLTHSEGVFTSGGATNTFHLLLLLVELHCDREKAVQAAKYFAIDMDRHKQAYFGVFEPILNHRDELVSSVQRKIEKSFSDNTTIEEMLVDIPASRRNIVRRFKLATNCTPIEYLQKTRIEAAKKMLEQTNNTILEVMMDCGYNDLKAFRQLFRRSTGMTPTSYREKFGFRMTA